MVPTLTPPAPKEVGAPPVYDVVVAPVGAEYWVVVVVVVPPPWYYVPDAPPYCVLVENPDGSYYVVDSGWVRV